MKTMSQLVITLGVLVSVSPAFAVTCQVLEADGVSASGKTKIEAEKNAWKACISRKISQREALRGPVDADAALDDAEPCLNAKMKCQ
jgi:hypothetical protein